MPDAHSERECFSLGAKVLRDTLGKQMTDSLTKIDGYGKETREEVKEGVGTVVIECHSCTPPSSELRKPG